MSGSRRPEAEWFFAFAEPYLESIDGTRAEGRASIEYSTAGFLKNRGDLEQAEAYFSWSDKSIYVTTWVQVLTRAELRAKRGASAETARTAAD